MLADLSPEHHTGAAVNAPSRAAIAGAALPFILYQRDDCHLCDLALEVLAAARVPEFDSVFIGHDPGLEQRYGARVPVLRDQASGGELDWPFTVGQVRDFL